MARLRAKAKPQYTIPGTLRTRVTAGTLRDWLQRYRRGGFDARIRKARRPRSVRQVIAGAIGSGHQPDGVRLKRGGRIVGIKGEPAHGMAILIPAMTG